MYDHTHVADEHLSFVQLHPVNVSSLVGVKSVKTAFPGGTKTESEFWSYFPYKDYNDGNYERDLEKEQVPLF